MPPGTTALLSPGTEFLFSVMDTCSGEAGRGEGQGGVRKEDQGRGIREGRHDELRPALSKRSHLVQDSLHAGAVDARWLEVNQDEVVVGAVGHDVVAQLL